MDCYLQLPVRSQNEILENQSYLTKFLSIEPFNLFQSKRLQFLK